MKRKRPPLSKKRLTYVDERASGLLVGTPLSYSAPVADRYKRSLDRLIEQMRKEYEREISKLWRDYAPITQDASLASQSRIGLNKLRDKFARLFDEKAPLITEQMLGGVDKHSAMTLKQSLKELSGGVTLKTSIMPAALKESLTAAAVENVALIRSVATQYHERIEGAVMRSIQQGGEGRKTIMDTLMDIGDMSARRAKLISQDQTRKALNASNVERAKLLGIKRGRWLHSGAGVEKREKHVAFSGKIFDLNDPPAIGDKGQKVMPAQEVNCRCTWTPVLEWGQDE